MTRIYDIGVDAAFRSILVSEITPTKIEKSVIRSVLSRDEYIFGF